MHSRSCDFLSGSRFALDHKRDLGCGQPFGRDPVDLCAEVRIGEPEPCGDRQPVAVAAVAQQPGFGQARVGELRHAEALRTAGALHEGTDVACSLLGTVGQPQRPSDHAMIGVLRDLHRKACGVQAAGKWWHSDDQSRDLYAQAAALIALGANPAPVPWKTMDGSITMMTSQTLLAVLGALAVSDTTHHALAEQARAQLAAGSLADVHAITWPAGYADA